MSQIDPTSRELVEVMRATERAECALFSVVKPFSEHLEKWTDEALRDKYDANFFDCTGQPTREEYERAAAFQLERGDRFIKLESDEPLADSFGLDESVTLTMVLTGDTGGWKNNPGVRLGEPTLEELTAIEVKHYGAAYGEDFCVRNIRRQFEKLRFHGAYLDGRLVGACHSFEHGGYTCLDGLIVDTDYRKRYVATTLLASCVKGKTFLHADADDTPKDLYARLGFVTVDRLYEYLKTDL